jgi:flavocytochrome c
MFTGGYWIVLGLALSEYQRTRYTLDKITLGAKRARTIIVQTNLTRVVTATTLQYYMSFISFVLRLLFAIVTLITILVLNFWYFLEYSAPITTRQFLLPVNETRVKSGENAAPFIQTITTKHGNISYQDVGSARSYPILFFHDWLPGSRKWIHIDEEKYARSHGLRIIHVDQPGYGLTNPNIQDFTSSVVNGLGLKKFSVIAFGRGSQFVNYISDLAESVVLLDPSHSCEFMGEYDSHLRSWIWRFISQLGFTFGEYDYWPFWARTLNCDAKLDQLLENAEWKNVFNQSMAESFRQGVLDPFTLKHESPNFAKLPANHLIISQRQICDKCNIQVTDLSHYQIYAKKFIDSLQYIANHTTISPKTRVAIIGGGLAGLSAAIEAHDRGAQVFLIDKEPRLGGNSAKATSGMNAIYTWTQKANNINDTYDEFLADSVKSTKSKGKTSTLLQTLVRESTSAFNFLEKQGLNLSLVSQCGGHSQPRTHRDDPPAGVLRNVGMSIIQTLIQAVKNRSIEIMTSTPVTKLLYENNAVTGVKFNDTEFKTDVVILTSGGFGADREGLLKTHAPQLLDYPSTNGAFATGDLLKEAEQIGAALVDMKEIQVHPTGLVDPTKPDQKTLFLAAESLRAYGAILICKGKRFVNELGRRDEVTDAILKHCENQIAFMLLNSWGAEQFGETLLNFYRGKGLLNTFDNFAQMSRNASIPHSDLLVTIKSYNAAVAKTRKDPFGKTIFPTPFDVNEIVHVMHVTPVIHYTMGGVRFNKNGQVLDKTNKPIQNLYAAGEVTGGLHGKNRLAGNSLLECVVYGRRSAIHATS